MLFYDKYPFYEVAVCAYRIPTQNFTILGSVKSGNSTGRLSKMYKQENKKLFHIEMYKC